MEVNKKIALVKWVVIIILSILLFNECRKHINNIPDDKPKPDTTSTNKVDTVWAKDTLVVFKDKLVPYYIYLHDTTFIPITLEDCRKTKLYLDTLDNSQLTIYDSIWVQGLIRKKSTGYKLKVPLFITDSVTTTIKVPTLYPPNYELHIGALIGYNLLAPTVDLSIKRHTMTVGYNIQTKQPVLGYKFTIFRK